MGHYETILVPGNPSPRMERIQPMPYGPFWPPRNPSAWVGEAACLLVGAWGAPPGTPAPGWRGWSWAPPLRRDKKEKKRGGRW